MENKRDIKLSDKFKYICCAFLILQIIVTVCLNLTQSEKFLDYDSSLVLRHAVEMWSHKTIALPDYKVTSSLELDCAAFWAAPIYMLTKNLSLSYALVHMILMFIVLYTVNAVLLRNNVKSSIRFLTMSVIITPYAWGQLEYINMLFVSAGQYEFRLIIVLMLFYFTGLDIKKTPKYQWIPLMILYFLFLAVTAVSCGTYVPVLIIGPFILGIIVSWIIKKKISVFNYTTAFVAGSAMVSVGALVIRSIIGVSASSSNGYILCASEDFADNLWSCITGIFILLGGIPQIKGVKVLSLSGVATILKFLGCAVILAFTFWSCTKNKKIKKDNYFIYCICFAVCNLLVLILSDTRYGSLVFESRYHILWIIVMFMLSAVCLDRVLKSETTVFNKKIIMTSVICWLIAVNAEGYLGLFRWQNYCAGLENKVAEVVNENNADSVLLYEVPNGVGVSHILRAKMPYIKSYGIEDNFTSAETLDFYRDAADSEALGKKNVLFITQDNFAELPEYIKNKYTFIDEFDGISYYYTDNNPCDFSAGFPGQRSDISVDYPYTIGYSSEHGSILPDDGSLVSDGKEGQVLQGVFNIPGDFKERDYSVKLEYNMIESKNKNAANLVIWADKTVIAEKSLEPDSKEITIDNIDFIMADYITVSVIQQDGTVLEIDKLVFKAEQMQ